MNKLLLSVAQKIGYVVAAGIIFVAVVVCTVRIVTPILDAHRAEIEKWASQLLNSPVVINNVRISWYQYQPEVSLNKVTILNKETQAPVIQIQQVNVFFSIPQSIWQRKIVPSGIMISGANVNLHETASGEISVQGFPSLGGFNAEPYKSETKVTDVVAWLSMQPRLILRNIDIRYTKFNGQKKFVTLYDLIFNNSGDHHLIWGKAILHQTIATEMTVAVKWLGQTPDLTKIKAKIYIYVSGLSIPQWFKEFSWKGWQVNQGIISAKLWATWIHGSFHKIQSTFQAYDLNLYSASDKSAHIINRLSGNVGWKQENTSQVFAGNDILIDFPQHLWPVTNFYIALNNANGVFSPKTINVGYLDFKDVQDFLFSSPAPLSEATRKMLTELQLNGALQNAAITFSDPWTDWHRLSLTANVSQLSFAPWHQFPGVNHLSGMIRWANNKGEIALHSNRVRLQTTTLFANPINIDQLDGDVQWQRNNDNAWLLRIASLQIQNNDLAANMSGLVTLPAKASPVVDLKANLTMQNANHFARYIPISVFDPELVQWLRQAFLSGEISSATGTLQGPLVDFPFDRGNGIFKILGNVNNVDLSYAPGWPIMRHTNGSLLFSGRRLDINVDHAEIANIPLTHVHGEIPYLGDAKPQVLNVQSDEIITDFPQGLRFVHMSPLEETIGKMFAGIAFQGPMKLKLGLSVPLKQPKDTQVQGNITLKNTQMNLAPWHLQLANLNGQVHFTENSTDATSIQGLLFNKPLTINLATIQKSKDLSVVQVNANTHLDMRDLENWLKLPFSKVVQGSADVKTQISFSLKTPLEIALQSNLAGMTIDLPDQYGKKANETRNFSTNIIIQDQQPLRLKLSYGNLLNAALILNRKQDEFNLTSANLHFGAGLATWPSDSGLYITGEFDQLDGDKLKNYANESSHNKTFSSLPLRAIDIKANLIKILGQRLTQVRLQATAEENHWDININSPEIAGEVQAPKSFNVHELMMMQFDHIDLQSSTGLPHSNQLIDVKTLPSMSFIANNVRYNNMSLGQVSLKTLPNANGLTIQSFRVVSPRIDLQAIGDWTATNVTHLRGRATSTHVSDLLTSLGLDVHNVVANDGKLDFNLAWHGAPYAPSLAALSGTTSLNLGRGRIVDVGQASGAKMDLGRMLSIFSLQTIPRRLTFDFSDVFQKGYSFDSVRGDFNLKNGDAYTNNLRFEGPVARVSINGRIGLKNKDYEFTLSVTPYVTSSIPVAATIYGLISIGNPVVGLAAAAANTVLGPAVSKATTYYYAVSGPWNNPAWHALSGANK